MSEHNSNNEEGDELENEPLDVVSGVSVSQGVLTTPLGSWPISKISEVKIHARPDWLTLVFALVAGFVAKLLFVWTYNVDPKSFRPDLVFILAWLCVVGNGRVVVKIRTEGNESVIWEEKWILFGKIHSDKGSASRVHELISRALSTKVS